jgi:hypothetical protein
MNAKPLCLAALFLLAACGEQERAPAHNGSPTPPINVAKVLAENAAAPQAARQDAALKIKGLFLGMDIHDAPGAIMSMLAAQGLADYGFTDVLRTGGDSQCVLLYTKSYLAAMTARMEERHGKASAPARVDNELITACLHADGVMAVKADVGKEVSSIEFSNVKELFDAHNLTAAEFAKKLSAELKLPEELKPNAEQTQWTYASPEGDMLEVSSNDVLGIPRVWLRLSRKLR